MEEVGGSAFLLASTLDRGEAEGRGLLPAELVKGVGRIGRWRRA